MKITDFSVKNYQFTLIVFVMLAAIGVNSLLNMPRGMDPDKKYQDVVRELDAIRPDLPRDIQSINVQKFSPSDVNILQVALVSETTPYKEMEEWSKKLKERLEKIKSLKNVDNWAFPKQQVRVSLNLERLAQNKIPLNTLLRAIQSENVNIPAGSIEMGARKFNIKTSGDYKSVDEIKNTIVTSDGGRIIYVKDLADVEFNYEEQNYIGRLNGKRAVFVTASRKAGTNIFAVEKEMEPVLQAFQKELPPHIAYE